MELDINLRVRVHELEQYLAARKVEGLIETSPGVRSVVIEYDQRRLPLPKLLEVRWGVACRSSTAAALGTCFHTLLLTCWTCVPVHYNRSFAGG